MSNYQHERGWLDSDVWDNAPYDERGAWSWLIGEAAWTNTTKSVNGRPVCLKRGELTSSLRFMADKWQWDKNKVDRYLKKLKLWSMIEIGTDTETGQTVVTICNYDEYQKKKGKIETENGTEAGQPRDRGGTEAGQTINPSNPSIPSSQGGDARAREDPPEEKIKKPDKAVYISLSRKKPEQRTAEENAYVAEYEAQHTGAAVQPPPTARPESLPDWLAPMTKYHDEVKLRQWFKDVMFAEGKIYAPSKFVADRIRSDFIQGFQNCFGNAEIVVGRAL